MLKPKKFLLFLSVLLFSIFSSLLFAEETVTITTYYPSPYGSYNELQLYPHSTPSTSCNSTTRGTMYYDSDDNQTKICDGSDWQIIGGTPSGAVMYFNLIACPGGWTALTAAQGRYLVGLPSGGILGATVGTALSNQEDRQVGQHNHTITDPGHIHTAAIAAVSNVGCGGSWRYGGNAYTGDTGSSVAGITVDNAGTTMGTNAPYLELLVCQKN